MAILGACGGSAGPTASLAPGTTGQPTATARQTTGGGSLTSDGVAAALAKLEAQDSWTFTAKYWTGSGGDGTEQSVDGTQRQKPEVAIDATHHNAETGDFRYIRIGDDIWASLGTDQFAHYNAEGSENLISQYEPFYIANLVADAAGSQIEYDPVGVETVNGVAATHFTLSNYNREKLTELSGLEPGKWAGEVYLANDGGWLVRFAWGPQNVEDAQPIMGFLYDTTAINCSCPIEPPTNVMSP